MATPPYPTRHASCPGEDMMAHRPGLTGGGIGGGMTTKVENLEVFMPAPGFDGEFFRPLSCQPFSRGKAAHLVLSDCK